MSDPFVSEIRMFPGNFAPRGWAFCNGQLLPISQNTALFSLLGTTYGGNGVSNFGLPNMQGRVPIFWGQGAGLSLRDIGEQDGAASVTLLTSEIPAHSHSASASAAAGTRSTNPTGRFWGAVNGLNLFNTAADPAQNLNPGAIGTAGGSQPHENRMPYLVVNFIIAMQGVFPQRS